MMTNRKGPYLAQVNFRPCWSYFLTNALAQVSSHSILWLQCLFTLIVPAFIPRRSNMPVFFYFYPFKDTFRL